MLTTKASIGQSTGPSIENIAAQIGVDSIEILEKDMGDLTGDGSEEYVAALQTLKMTDGGRERLVVIYQQRQGQWILWKSSSSPILGSEEGGVLGDPFGDISIEDQRLQISHYGGSNWRWSMEDFYRHHGADLILSEHHSYWGSFCDEKVDWEINLAEGLAHCAYGQEECPEGFGDNRHIDSIPKTETFQISKELKITLEQRNDTIVHFVSPIYGFETSLQ